MALTRNSIFNLSKAFPRPSIFICRQVWKGGDVVTEDKEQLQDNKSKGDNGTGGTGGDGWYNEASKVAEKSKDTKDRATETAQEAWRVIEEAAGEMKHRVVANMDANKETDIRDEMVVDKEEEERTKN